jgi:hypothetical protein
MWIRLRQIAMVVADLNRVVEDLQSVFGLEVAHIDPGVEVFGLENRILPIGSQFLEVLTPIREDTAGGRYMARRGGDTGYMVICQTDDHASFKARVRQLGIRSVWERDGAAYSLLQLHPKDTGGSFLEVDWAQGGEDPSGPWPPAGDHWQPHVRTEIVRAITAAEIQSPTPEPLAERWAAIPGPPARPRAGGEPTIRLQNADLRFVLPPDGRPEGLGGIDLEAADAGTALARARERGLPVEGSTLLLGGMRFRLVGGRGGA